MPLQLNIEHLCLGFGEDAEGSYLYLIDNANPKVPCFSGGVRYLVHQTHIECKNMVSDGFGPTLLILLAQEARRLKLNGVTPDSNKNSAEAETMLTKMVNTPPQGVHSAPTNILSHSNANLNRLFKVTEDVIAECKARQRFETHLGKGWRGWLFRCRYPRKGMAARWINPDAILSILKRDYLDKSDEVFR